MIFYKAYALTDEKKSYEAIEQYTKAFELFPLFHEAMDNRAFVNMNMGKWLDAIADFQISLWIFPVSTLAEFSIEECYLNMGHMFWLFNNSIKSLQLIRKIGFPVNLKQRRWYL